MGAAKRVLDLAQQTHRDMAVGFDDDQMALLFGGRHAAALGSHKGLQLTGIDHPVAQLYLGLGARPLYG